MLKKKPYMDLADYPRMVDRPESPKSVKDLAPPPMSHQTRILSGVTTAMARFLTVRRRKYDLREQHRAPSVPGLNGAIKGAVLVPGRGLGMTLCQAARDGLLDVIQMFIASGTSVHEVDEDGFTPLHHAARYNRVRVMEALVSAGAAIDKKGGHEETTPLHLACRYNSVGATQFLLTRGTNSNVRDIKGKTPLHYATRRGYDVIAKMLLSVANCSVDAADNDKTTPLIMASIQGNLNICELLISRRAKVDKRDINDMTALMWAASEGHLPVVELLIKAEQKQNQLNDRMYVNATDNEGNTALHLAVQNGFLEVCEHLVNRGADINCQKLNLISPLHLAATSGDIAIARYLVAQGAEVNIHDSELMTPVHKAAQFNKVDVLELLHEHGGNLNAKDKQNMSPLHRAAWKGQTEALEYLLKHQAHMAHVDSSLKTALHWAVQYGHFNALMTLLKYGGSEFLRYTDKNDQTVLHYAAYTGNVSILNTLLESGASTDTRDQEERSALHIAAMHDNVSCVEALINASNREINDDDVDGHTPLLLACLSGHHRVVQVLLTLGADISKRDAEQCSGLMLAAAQGHSSVMKFLLDNQAQVNDADKLRNSALHYACAGGHLEAVQLLLSRKADVTVKNTHDQSPLELAIDHMQSEVVCVMLKHKSWRDSLSVRDSQGRGIMDRLIAKLPEGAHVVLDHCLERSSRDDDDPTLMMTFDYYYLDPGPDDPGNMQIRYLALNTMVAHGNDKLLQHPVVQSLLAQKWINFGRTAFYCNLFVHFGYFLTITLYIDSLKNIIHPNQTFDVNGCPIIGPSAKNVSHIEYFRKNEFVTIDDRKVDSSYSTACGVSLLTFVIILVIREFFKIMNLKLKYFINMFNILLWIMFISTFAFLHPLGIIPCLEGWRFGWLAVFLACINFIMYLRRIHFVGIYVSMFVSVLYSYLRAVLVYVLFCWAFALSFFIVLSNGSEHFRSIHLAMYNTMVMSLGEMEFLDAFTPNSSYYDVDNFIIFTIFIFIMPIVLMNLLIGVAVGDIDKVQRNAYLKKISLQIELLYKIENAMPRWLQHRVYKRRAHFRPNEVEATSFGKFKKLLLGNPMNVRFMSEEEKDLIDQTNAAIAKVQEELNAQQNRIRTLVAQQQQQTALLHQIALKLNVHSTLDQDAGGQETYLQVPAADEDSSMYDNMSVHIAPQRPWSRSRLSLYEKLEQDSRS